MRHRKWTIGLTLALAVALVNTSMAEGPAPAPQGHPATPSLEKLGTVTREQSEADRSAQAAQQRINALDDETQKLLSEYRRATADAESFAAYADQLERQIASQNQELAEVDRQLAEIETTSRSIVPLEQKMLSTLRQFVDLDVPFLAEERAARVKTLEEAMDRADVSISEKYRRIVEAYQVEMDYGRTIEAYEGQLHSADGTRTANFLRVGRVALLYQTLDGRETGYWDIPSRRWVVDNRYAHAFQQGVAVARKSSAPEMLIAPVPAPQQAKPVAAQAAPLAAKAAPMETQS